VLIERVGDGGVVAARHLVDEYLGDVAGFECCYRWREDTVLVAHEGGRCVGVCYATPSDGHEIGLAGIAVDDAVSGRGIGSQLLAAFEENVAAAGFRQVILGSAAGYAEHFYEKNGYRPIEYLVTVPSDVAVERLAGLPITRLRRRGDVTLVNVISTAGRDPQAKAAVLAACRGTAVNIIYRKQLA
jgi:GNAT superfamily N-acetyltransferase